MFVMLVIYIQYKCDHTGQTESGTEKLVVVRWF